MKRVVRLLGVGLLLLVVLLLILFVLAQTTPLISAQDEHAVWLRLLITAIVICLLSMCIFFLFSFRQNEASTISLYAQPTDIKEINTEQPNYASLLTIYLRDRYGPFWRRKVRLLLVTGEPEQAEAIAPGLTGQHWLEGDHTVLIYGGRPTAEPDVTLLTALKKLRRSRPLDGIIWALTEEQSRQTAQLDKGWRGLINGGKRLGFQAPLYLWQVCDDGDYQTGRPLQSVGCLLPERCTPEQLAVMLEAQTLPLTEQGMSQLLTDNRHDFLLRLAHTLAERGIAHWQTVLKPLLAGGAFSSLRLRGLMFSPPLAAVPEAAPHAWLPSPVWAGVTGDNARGARWVFRGCVPH